MDLAHLDPGVTEPLLRTLEALTLADDHATKVEQYRGTLVITWGVGADEAEVEAEAEAEAEA